MYTIEEKVVSDAVWWKPFTWRNSHIETRRCWDMDYPIVGKEKMRLFMNDNCGPYGMWERVNSAQ